MLGPFPAFEHNRERPTIEADSTRKIFPLLTRCHSATKVVASAGTLVSSSKKTSSSFHSAMIFFTSLSQPQNPNTLIIILSAIDFLSLGDDNLPMISESVQTKHWFKGSLKEAYRVYNPKVRGSNHFPATKSIKGLLKMLQPQFIFSGQDQDNLTPRLLREKGRVTEELRMMEGNTNHQRAI